MEFVPPGNIAGQFVISYIKRKISRYRSWWL